MIVGGGQTALETAAFLAQKGKEWLLLLTDIEPIIFFPEYILENIKNAVHSEDSSKKIPLEVAKLALDLLEVAYPEKLSL